MQKLSFYCLSVLLTLAQTIMQAEPLFTEDFTSATFPPAGWVTDPTSGQGDARWTRSSTSAFTGSPCAKGGFNVAACWLVTTAINIPTTGTYTLSWKSTIDSPSYYAAGGKNIILVSKTANTIPGDFQEIWVSPSSYGSSTARLTLNEATNFSANAGDIIYIAFRRQGLNAHDWYLDDIVLEMAIANDLQIIAGFPYNSPYTQIPVSQNIFTGKAVNNGSAAQTDVRLFVSVNGVSVDSSAPVPTLVAGETSQDLTADNVPLVTGNNIITLSVAADEQEEKPEDNSTTFSVKTSATLYAADDLTTFTNGVGNSYQDDYAAGQIYKIVKPTDLSGALIGFKDATPMDVKIELYRMVLDDETETAPVASAIVTRTTSGLNLFAFPDTTLTVGDYFLSVQQLSAENMGLARQSEGTRYEKSYEILEPKDGAVAARLVLKTAGCNPLTGLKADADYREVVFSWNTGSAFLHHLTVSQGENVIGTYTTTDTTLTVSYLQSGTEYSWQITSFCDASTQVQTPKMTFYTKSCAQQVAVFPFVEDFETGTSSCWNYGFNGSDMSDYPSRDFDNSGEDHLGSSHSGEYGWRFSSEKSDNLPDNNDSYAWLITPGLAQTAGNKTLNFWYKSSYMFNYALMCVGYSTTDDNLRSFTFSDTIQATSNWQQFNKNISGNVKHIMFYYIEPYSGKYMYIDDITIDMVADAPLELTSTNIGDNAQSVSINTDFQAYFTRTINITGNADNIVFKDEDNTPVEKTVQAQDRILTITPVSALKYNTTYTIIVPAGYIENYNEEISRTFTTELPVGINIAATKPFSTVFPTLCKGDLTVTTASKATVEIFNFSGTRLKSYVSNGKLNINLNYASGIYFVVVRAGDKAASHKIILQR
ncbi:MAG: choice-of-anchor J domain-containing protein [Bacteroidales bacterium]|jgi:hypothetical protein|nr:choice-of-anchor J domain-containing protein [Bacteroidales bacterium]